MAEKRAYKPREQRLVNEWLQTKHPNWLQWKRVRLGPLPPGKPGALYGIVRRWADAVLFDGETIYIVEAKIRPDVGAIAQLELYKRLFPKTPEFSMFKDRPIKLIFLTTVRDAETEALCKEKGIIYEVFRPPWIVEYWHELLAKAK